jgi:ABC-type tungstate transport system permease subunit
VTPSLVIFQNGTSKGDKFPIEEVANHESKSRSSNRILVSPCIFFYILIPLSVSGKEIQQIVVATGSPYELGLGDALGNAFQKETGCTVRWIKTPTGPGLELGKHGLAHVTMGHNREATAKVFKEGYTIKKHISCTT